MSSIHPAMAFSSGTIEVGDVAMMVWAWAGCCEWAFWCEMNLSECVMEVPRLIPLGNLGWAMVNIFGFSFLLAG